MQCSVYAEAFIGTRLHKSTKHFHLRATLSNCLIRLKRKAAYNVYRTDAGFFYISVYLFIFVLATGLPVVFSIPVMAVVSVVYTALVSDRRAKPIA